MIALPDHGCCADPRLAGFDVYGELDAANVATCALRRRWDVRPVDFAGCGARLAVCYGCGLRTRITRPAEVEAPPCAVCSATVRPTLLLTVEPARAVAEAVDPARSIVQPEAPVDTAVSRAEKGRPPPKARAVAKRAKKGTAASDEPTLPGLK